jgi:tripartite-type tricarboxylate transporter receptor subunit TctC
VLVVAPAAGINSVQDLIAAAKAKPGQLQYASGGNGSSLHLAGELFKYMAGVDILHIPYKGTNDFIPDLLSGRVPISFSSPLVMQPHVKAGRLKALAVTSLKRAPGWTDVPTIDEAGVKGYEMDAWYAILVPAGTPQALVAQMNKHMAQALHAADVQEKLTGSACRQWRIRRLRPRNISSPRSASGTRSCARRTSAQSKIKSLNHEGHKGHEGERSNQK